MTFARIIDVTLATGSGLRGERVELLQFTDGGYGIAINGEVSCDYYGPRELDSAVDAYAGLVHAANCLEEQ